MELPQRSYNGNERMTRELFRSFTGDTVYADCKEGFLVDENVHDLLFQIQPTQNSSTDFLAPEDLKKLAEKLSPVKEPLEKVTVDKGNFVKVLDFCCAFLGGIAAKDNQTSLAARELEALRMTLSQVTEGYIVYKTIELQEPDTIVSLIRFTFDSG